MRPGVDKEHFRECDVCHGRGRIRNGDSLGSENLRQAAFLLSRDEVGGVELVCHPEIAQPCSPAAVRNSLPSRRNRESPARQSERSNDSRSGRFVCLRRTRCRSAHRKVQGWPVPKFEHLQKEAELRAEAVEQDDDDETSSGTGRAVAADDERLVLPTTAAVALSEDLQRELEEIEQEELRA